jgi:soluble lytic murein transglycosylase-like protein
MDFSTPCLMQAAADYAIPARALLALNVALTKHAESGVTTPRPPFPISRAWRVALARDQPLFTEQRLTCDVCWSGRAAAYILRYEINLAQGDFWQGVSRMPYSVPPGHMQRGEALRAVVSAASQRHGLDMRLVEAVIQVESGYVVPARSHKGALGLMQVIPATAARYGVHSSTELLQPAVNIEVGTRYLRDLTTRFRGNIPLTLAAYNAGEGAVAKYGNHIPPYPETRDYVRKVLSLYAPAFTHAVYEASQQF